MPTGWRVWLRGTDAQLVGLTLLTKVLLLSWGLVVVAASQGQAVDIGQAFAIWNRWDAPHYLDLAIWGYMAVDPCVSPTYGITCDMDLMIVFYPLFPALIGGARLFVPDLVAPLLISTVASVVAVLLLYRVVARELGEAAGRRAAVFLLVFPTAYFLHIGYTESLFLALSLAALLAARSGRWAVAGGAGGLAAFTRVNGLALIPSLIAEAWTEWRSGRQLRPGWAWIGLVAAGFGAYLLVNQVVYGDPFAFVTILREHWSKALAWPWEGVADVVSRLGAEDLEGVLILGVAELAAIVLGVVGTVVAMLRFRPSWAVWMAVNVVLFVSTSFALSVPRYVLVLFPLYAWFAILAERRWLGVAIGVVSVGLLLWFSARFATGAWAF
jgi:Dolichyl-phosphate-mannose-protein mannosyltransferase